MQSKMNTNKQAMYFSFLFTYRSLHSLFVLWWTASSLGALAENTASDDMYTLGDDLYTQGDDMYTQGDDMYTQGDDMYTQGDDLYTQGDDVTHQVIIWMQ